MLAMAAQFILGQSIVSRVSQLSNSIQLEDLCRVSNKQFWCMAGPDTANIEEFERLQESLLLQDEPYSKRVPPRAWQLRHLQANRLSCAGERSRA
jgi:hypothetical protein